MGKPHEIRRNDLQPSKLSSFVCGRKRERFNRPNSLASFVAENGSGSSASAQVTHSLCKGQQKCKMRDLEIQIGNSDFI